MKYSGVEWIGNIPDAWRVCRFKDIKSDIPYAIVDGPFGSAISTNDYKDSGVPLIRIVNLKQPGLTGEDIRYISEEHAEKVQRSTTRIGDIIFAKTGATVGKCAINDLYEEAILSSSCVKITINPQYNNKYFYYLFLTSEFNSILRISCNGTTRDTINLQPFNNLQCCVPPINEQRKIVNYLDKKIFKIDSLIEIENQQIEKLKEYKQAVITEAVTRGLDKNVPMKDSGVEWIGDVPQSYVMKKMGWLADYKKGPFGSSLKISMFVPKGHDTYKVYEQKNAIYKDETLGYYYISKEKFDELSSNEVLPGDIIVSCAGTIGECFQMPKTMEPGIINQALMRVRLNDEIMAQYFLYLFDAVISKASQTSSNGSAMKNIPPFDVLKNMRVYIPTKENQELVIKNLDNKCADIDKLIEIKQQKIGKLEDYKKSLIYEYVTGKKHTGNMSIDENK